MARSIAIIGAGQIGYAAAHEFFAAGWDVSVHARSRPEWDEFSKAWHAYVAGESPTPKADVVLDTIAFDEADIARYDPDRVGRLIAVSSASVYCDDRGRTLDEGPIHGYPEFAGPITEDQATVLPGPESYSTRKIRMENTAIEMFGDRATILRPCAIYGEQSRHPREWWFVKRLLDGRTKIPLIFDGRSQFQTSDVAMIAATACAAAQDALGGVFNIADTNAPSVREIGEAIAGCLGRDVNLIGVEDSGLIGRTPWSVPKPFIVSGKRANAITGGQPSEYREHLRPAVDWLCDLNPTDWRAAFPQLAAYPWDLFDYAAEDVFFKQLH